MIYEKPIHCSIFQKFDLIFFAQPKLQPKMLGRCRINWPFDKFRKIFVQCLYYIWFGNASRHAWTLLRPKKKNLNFKIIARSLHLRCDCCFFFSRCRSPADWQRFGGICAVCQCAFFSQWIFDSMQINIVLKFQNNMWMTTEMKKKKHHAVPFMKSVCEQKPNSLAESPEPIAILKKTTQ